MKQFVDDGGKGKVERKILWIERYFLGKNTRHNIINCFNLFKETTKYCLKDSSSSLHQNQIANIFNIINGNNNNIVRIF